MQGLRSHSPHNESNWFIATVLAAVSMPSPTSTDDDIPQTFGGGTPAVEGSVAMMGGQGGGQLMVLYPLLDLMQS